MKTRKRISALLLAMTIIFTGCAGNDSSTENSSIENVSSYLEIDIFPMPVDHKLWDVDVMSYSVAKGSSTPKTSPISDENKRLYFKLDSSLSMIVLRDWNASDLSVYAPNGYVSLDVRGSGKASFDIGFGEMIGSEYVQKTIRKKDVELSDEWTTIEIPLAEIDPEMLHIRDFLIGNADGEIYVSSIAIASPDSEKIYPAIKVNQQGYKPDSEKIALVTGFADEIEFSKDTEYEVVDNSEF